MAKSEKVVEYIRPCQNIKSMDQRSDQLCRSRLVYGACLYGLTKLVMWHNKRANETGISDSEGAQRNSIDRMLNFKRNGKKKQHWYSSYISRANVSIKPVFCGEYYDKPSCLGRNTFFLSAEAELGTTSSESTLQRS